MEKSLAELRPGQSGIVMGLPPEREDWAGLARLGLLPGTEIRCLRRCPLGDPTVYRFRGTELALRRRDAGRILVAEAEADSGEGEV